MEQTIFIEDVPHQFKISFENFEPMNGVKKLVIFMLPFYILIVQIRKIYIGLKVPLICITDVGSMTFDFSSCR